MRDFCGWSVAQSSLYVYPIGMEGSFCIIRKSSLSLRRVRQAFKLSLKEGEATEEKCPNEGKGPPAPANLQYCCVATDT